MTHNNQPIRWETDTKEAYVPITYEGTLMGFGKPKFAVKVVEVLNEEERLRKAFKLACKDLLTYVGGDVRQVDDLIEKYLIKADRPRSGTGAIVNLLRDRMADLDVTAQEFARFCDSYRLSLNDLKRIYAGEKIPDNLLGPLARILGMTVEEVIAVRDGKG